MKDKIEIQILTPATREELIELRDELRKIEGLESLDLKLPPAPLIQGKMSSAHFTGNEIIDAVLTAAVMGLTHYGGERVFESVKEATKDFFEKISKKRPRVAGVEVEAEAMSGTQAVENHKWKVAISENKNGAKSVSTLDETGAVSVFSNREYSIDPEHTYAVLIGVSDYDDSTNFSRIPPVAGNMDTMYNIFTDKRLVGLPFENISRLYNENCIAIKDELRRVSRINDIKTLIIYYTGHGENTGNNQLSLIAKDTRNIDEELHNDIPYAFIEKMMNTSPADQKLVFIDACHSGLAAQSRSNNVFDFEPVVGTFTLASTSADESSYFKKDAANTYFTSYLAEAFKEGISNSNTMLSLTDLYKYTSEKLVKNKLPAAVQKTQLKNILADNFYISGNPAFSLEARLNTPKLLYQQGKYEEARREYILLEKEYPENQQLKNEHIEFERNSAFNRLVKDGDLAYFRDKNYTLAIAKYREALTLKSDEGLRDKIADCTKSMQEHPQQQVKQAFGQEMQEMKKEDPGIKKQTENNYVKKETVPVPVPPNNLRKILIGAAGIAVLALVLYFMFGYHGKKTVIDPVDKSSFSYWGEMKNDLPDGHGRSEYKNGNKYEGEWTNGMLDGHGEYIYANGNVYTGYFKNNYLNGIGKMKYQGGDEYEGNWSFGIIQGKGVCKYANGNSYDGYWINNKYNGNGLFTWANGDTYSGNFKDGSRDGRGTYTSATGDLFNCPGCRKYIGQWKNDYKEGWGTCFDINGKLIYEGNFASNAPSQPYPNR